MKKIFIPAASLVLTVAAIFLAFLAYSGLFAKIGISEKKAGPYILAYDVSIGPYKKSAAVMERIYNTLLGEKGISSTKGFGLYYDNPETTAAEKLRSITGCIVESSDRMKLGNHEKGFRVAGFPESESVVAEFPYKGKVSVMIGVLRVYPELHKYMEQKNLKQGAVMEIYDVQKGTISYIVPAIKNETLESFLKPE